jgi:hypothetical protein
VSLNFSYKKFNKHDKLKMEDDLITHGFFTPYIYIYGFYRSSNKKEKLAQILHKEGIMCSIFNPRNYTSNE